MNWKRPAVIVVVGAAVGAWLTAAMTVPGSQSAPPAPQKPAAIDARSGVLATEIARLHDHLRPDATPRRPGRNLFAFHSAPPPSSSVIQQKTIVAPAPVVPEQPPLKLAGIAEDSGPDGPVRTAIITASAQLFLVKEGEAITSRYRVARILEDRVDITDTSNGSTHTLTLK
jgi:hypothetical protein